MYISINTQNGNGTNTARSDMTVYPELLNLVAHDDLGKAMVTELPKLVEDAINKWAQRTANRKFAMSVFDFMVVAINTLELFEPGITLEASDDCWYGGTGVTDQEIRIRMWAKPKAATIAAVKAQAAQWAPHLNAEALYFEFEHAEDHTLIIPFTEAKPELSFCFEMKTFLPS